MSIAEVDTQDDHKLLTIGFACVSNENRHADRMVRQILDFMETHTQAELIDVQIEVL